MPVACAGGINLLKVDSENTDTLLPGVEFELYRTAAQEEIAAEADGLVTLNGLPGSFVKVSFFDNLSGK